MNSVTSHVESLLKKLLVALSALIVVMVTWQVISRYVLQAPSSVTEEAARFLLIWISLFGAAYAYQTGSHLGLDILVNKLSTKGQAVAGIFSHLCVVGFALNVMVFGGFSLVDLTMTPIQTSAALEIKMGYVYFAVPLSGLIIVLFGINKIKQLASQIWGQ
ncbi:tripartite ATP-independent periplasmic transporter DctQ [Catenovulum agarivorans DS-2]|uniref:TRAP transporter small permease protein n=1 Tax=Catenovulum agarivorans DS-2 TaxID=1328313 RepID=W7QSQ9_9ALTE|nr:TRAP transporter small permease [Catenovulum agarivorans]EWH08420.1 tripartite ATP-independent periplasmic transporter DctQ [Catenovulum agarivorans DS-2]